MQSEKSYRLITFPDGQQYLAWFHHGGSLFNTLPATPDGRDMGDLNRTAAFPDMKIGDLLPMEVVRRMAGI